MNEDRRGVDITDQVIRQPQIVQERVVHQRVPAESEIVASDDILEHRSIVATPSMVVALLAGAALIVLGIVVLLRGDVSGPWTEPVDVSGLAHTVLLGVIDIGVGVLLLLLAFGPASGRVAAGVLLAIGGAVLWLANPDVRDDLAAQWGFGAAAVATGALIALLALVEGDRFRTHSRRVDRVVEHVHTV
ncbi:MAG: hypothetical protein AB7Q42_08845 [Acidimicrobiia bacterium]